MQIITKRLKLLPLCEQDLQNLIPIFTDPQTMSFYIKAYDESICVRIIERNMQTYKEHGFGLFGVILRETHQFIGDCGITLQNINGTQCHEIGYHFNKNFWGKGYASEAAQACKKYAFEVLGLDKVYSYMTIEHIASQRVAQKNGMTKQFEYTDEDENLVVYAITRQEYDKQQYSHIIIQS